MSSASDLFLLLIGISAVLILLIIGGLVCVRLVRGRTAAAAESGEPFSLQDLRDMRAAGQITDREFESMRAALLGRLTAPKPTRDATPVDPQGDERRDDM